MSLENLKQLGERKPRSIQEWLSKFPPEDQDIIRGAILNGDTNAVYRELTSLGGNPYPFQRDTLFHHRRILRMEEETVRS